MNNRTLAGTALTVTAAAAAGSIANPRRTLGWYERLRKPRYQPPGVVFPLVWTVLYADIAATSAVAIDRFRSTGQHGQARRYAAALTTNLVLNAGWSWLFFSYRRLGAAVFGAAALTASSADLVRRAARADSRAGAVLAPYPVWCGFATALATHIWRINR